VKAMPSYNSANLQQSTYI